jgi:hypothetical protein
MEELMNNIGGGVEINFHAFLISVLYLVQDGHEENLKTDNVSAVTSGCFRLWL